MYRHLSLLQTEIQLEIADYLKANGGDGIEDLRNWSCVSSYYRSLLAPYVFEAITLCNTEKSAASVNLIASGKYSKYTKQLFFNGSAPGDEEDEEAFADVVNVFPKDVQAILSDLNRFPKLETVQIEFPFDFTFRKWSDAFYMFEGEESEEEVLEEEGTQGWRALMAKTYAALSQNTNPGFKSLIIKDICPKEISTFNSKEFHLLLGHVERFEISVYGDDNGAGWKTNTLDGYLAFVAKFDDFFFNHLVSAADLTIKATNCGPIGLEGSMRHADLVLKSSQMPLLKAIHLEHIFICPELTDFLVAHADTLEVIDLNECYGGIGGMAINGIYWAELFTALSKSKPKKLHQLDILPTKIPLTYNEKYHQEFQNDEDSEDIVEARRILREDPKRRLFAYSNLDDKYGMLFADEEENLASFQKGDDQRAYDELMKIVQKNAAKIHQL